MTEDEYAEESESYTGFCLACGETQGQCEPDARKYTCHSCRMPKVYGLEQLLIMNLVLITAGKEGH